MRFQVAHVIGFGKLVDRVVRFAPGLHLVTGDNEAGKTTLHRFLIAMLFGMKREDRKRREYLAEHARYEPWSGAAYEGRVVFELEASGRRLELQRRFAREDESLQVLDALTGRDITAEFPMDARKERNVMAVTLRLTRRLFEATTSLGQLAARPEVTGVEQLRERIQGLIDSGDEATSARAALANLAQLRDELGTERTPTRGEGRLRARLQALQHQFDRAREEHAEIVELHRRRAGLTVAHQRAEAAWRRARAAERDRERRVLAERLAHAERLERELHELDARLQAYADVEGVDPGAEPQVRALQQALEDKQRRRDDLRARCAAAQTVRAELQRTHEQLEACLGGLGRREVAELQQAAEHLREEVGHYRAARQRHEQDVIENRDLVDRLRRHHGRDWTQDAFMDAVRRHQQVLAEATTDTLVAELAALGRAARRQARRLLGISGTGLLVALGTAAGVVWGPGSTWPLAVRIAAPLVLLALGVGLGWNPARALLRHRRRRVQLEHEMVEAQSRRRASRDWLQAALARNEVADVESLHAAHREYRELRERAERRADTSPVVERRALEERLAEAARSLRARRRACDVEALRRLVASASGEPARCLPFEEPPAFPSVEPEDPPEVRRLRDDFEALRAIRRGVAWARALQEEARRVEAEWAEKHASLQALEAELEGGEARYQELLRRNGAATPEELAARVARWHEREALLVARDRIRGEQRGVLGDSELTRLRAQVAELELQEREAASEFEGGGAGTHRDAPLSESASWSAAVEGPRAKAPLTADALSQRIQELTAERAQVDERLVSRERTSRMPAEIELEIEEVQRQLEQHRQRVRAVELAMRTLEDVTAAMHREVAPRMNVRVGEIFGRLSRGTHTQVLLDEELTPRVRTDGHRVHGVESLSGGAADQLYFALRVTAGEQLAEGGERLPLLLDDPFVQYDPQRLEAALDLVAELARHHQVVFFTCEAAQAEALAHRAAALEVPVERTHL